MLNTSAMPPKGRSLAERMRGLRCFVETNLELLRSRPGTSVLEKLRAKIPAERPWYDFVNRTTEKMHQTNWPGNTFAETRAEMAALNKLVCSTSSSGSGTGVPQPAASWQEDITARGITSASKTTGSARKRLRGKSRIGGPDRTGRERREGWGRAARSRAGQARPGQAG